MRLATLATFGAIVVAPGRISACNGPEEISVRWTSIEGPGEGGVQLVGCEDWEVSFDGVSAKAKPGWRGCALRGWRRDGALRVTGDPVPIDPDQPEQQVDLGVPSGSIAGVGARIRALGDGVRVEWVVASGPADRAGLGPGDLVLEVDGTPTAGLSTSDYTRLATGPEGSVVTYRVRFAEGHTGEVRMTRQRIPADWGSRRGQGELWDPSPFEAADR